jgi:ribosomal protein S18 acetylase RimI-like enzyme
MRLSYILYESIAQHIRVVPAEYSDEAFYDSDGYSIWEQAFAIASNSGIHIASNKELAFVAMDDATVVGGVWSARYHDEDQDAEVYDFDMAVDKNYRNQVGIFLKLMNAALGEYRDLLEYNPRTYIRVWVVNPRLIDVLERRYGFELESRHGNGSAHMTYYGK